MNSTAHSAHGLLLYYLLYTIIWHQLPPSSYGIFVIIFSNFPDFDGVYWKLKGGKYDNNFQHHLYSDR